MNIEQFTGKTVTRDGFDTVYDVAVEKLGGVHAIHPYIPFPDDILMKSYSEDKNFNTSLTPLERWQKASGIHVVIDQVIRNPVPTGTGLLQFTAHKGLNELSQSQAVCILKHAAEKICQNK